MHSHSFPKLTGIKVNFLCNKTLSDIVFNMIWLHYVHDQISLQVGTKLRENRFKVFALGDRNVSLSNCAKQGFYLMSTQS